MAKTPTEIATTPVGKTSSTDAFSKALQSRLLSASDAISSQDSNIESTFASAIAGQESAAASNEAAVTSEYNRQQEYARRTGDVATASQLEGRRGGVTSRIALLTLEEDTSKAIKDLEQRKKELILQGNAKAAENISNLQTQKLKFEADAKQAYFANLLGMGNYIQGQQTLEQNQSQFETGQAFNEKQFAWTQESADRDYAMAKEQMAIGNQQFEKNFGFNLMKFNADEKQRGVDNARADQQMSLAWADYGLKSALTDAQIKEITYNLESKVNAEGIVFPKAGKEGGDITFKPNPGLTASQQERVASTKEGMDLIKKAEELYKAAVANETEGPVDSLIARVLGEGAYATSYRGNKREVGAFLGSATAWKAYKDFLISNKSVIAKGIGGEVGNLAAQEQVDALLRLDATKDTSANAALKFSNAKNTMVTRLSTLGTVTQGNTAGQSTQSTQPQQMILNGQTLTLQADGTYQ